MKNLSHLNRYRDKEGEQRLYGAIGDDYNGIFRIYIKGRSFFVIASNGGGWDHVSVSPKNQKRCPTWDEMCAIKDLFFEETEVALQLHPAKSNYVNNHPFCLHLWRPQSEAMPLPPKIYV